MSLPIISKLVLWTTSQETRKSFILDSPGKSIFTTPYVDAGTGSVVVTASTPVRINSTKVGVVGIDFKLKTIQEIVLNINVGGDNVEPFFLMIMVMFWLILIIRYHLPAGLIPIYKHQ